jgi:hypothetical protein
MSDRTKLGLGILLAALVMGVLADAFLRATPWGINVTLWVLALVAAGIVLTGWQRVDRAPASRGLAIPLVLFAAFLAWRDSTVLKLLDVGALLALLSLAVVRPRSGSLRLAGALEYALGALLAGFQALLGIMLLALGDIQWKELPQSGWSRRALGAGRGLVIAVPLLLIFGGLFMAADAVFEGMVKNLFDIDFVELFTHLFVIGFAAWMVGGYLRGWLLGKEVPMALDGVPKSLTLGVMEIGTVLGLLDLLFLSFVIVQLRYLFGGAALVHVTPGLTYAQYARRGFFELVTVAALVLPLLLGGHWLLSKDDIKAGRVFRYLAGTQVLLLFVIMISAVQRMRLYQNEYGLTELRLYTTAFMGWLAVVFLWFAATVLRGQRNHFAFGALVVGFGMIATLHFFNPDGFIVRTNVARAEAGRRFDVSYAVSLSADAAPALVAAMPKLTQPERQEVASHLLWQWSPPGYSDWRAWSWSRRRAWQVTAENLPRLLRWKAGKPGGGGSKL